MSRSIEIEISTNNGMVEAIFVNGQNSGASVHGRTANMMRVRLAEADLPFVLGTPVADNYSFNLRRIYEITVEQHAAMTAALAAKVAANEEFSRSAPAALRA